MLVVLVLAAAATVASPSAAATSDSSYGRLPLQFEAAAGGAAGQTGDFVAHGPGYSVRLGATAAAFRFRHSPRVVRMRLENADPESRGVGLDQLPGTVSHLRGNDPSGWRHGVSTYARVRYPAVYPGVDLVYYGDQRRLEHDFIVAAGADPGVISLAFEGVDDLDVSAEGELVLSVAGTPVRFRKPTLYQEIDGARREITGGYVLKGPRRAGFEVGARDHERPVVIDPVLVYSTFLGGSGLAGLWDVALAIAVDAEGSAYVTGETVSADFPVTAGAPDTTCGRSGVCDEIGIVPDAFVAKLNPAGTALVYATYLGGRARDGGAAIAVDGEGYAYVTGTTESEDFPTTPGAFQPSCQLPGFSCQAGFVTKLSRDGTSLAYSTYLMGGKNGLFIAPTYPRAIAVDAQGNAYVTGTTLSPSFPTTAGAFQTTPGGVDDAFVIKLNAAGSAPVYSTYLGGRGIDGATGITVDARGHAYVVGGTSTWQQHQVNDFPVTPGAFQVACASSAAGFCADGFVAKLDPSGSALVYSTYLGGATDFDSPLGVAVDAGGHVYVIGGTKSTDFPVTGALGGPQSRPDPFGTGFITKLSPDGAALVYSVLLEGVYAGRAVAVDGGGSAFLTGDANPFAFVPSKPWPASGMNYDALLLKVDPEGHLAYSALVGGFGNDEGHGIALDAAGNVYLAGWATSYDFPLQGAMEIAGHRAFVAKLAEPGGSADLAVTMSGVYGVGPSVLPVAITYTIAVVNNGPDDAGRVTVQATGAYGEDIRAVTPSQGTCRSTADAFALVVCELGDLSRGAVATVTVGVLRTFATTAQWTVTVNSATADDPDRGNNRFTSPVVVNPVNVTKAGLGTGVVRSTPAGIDCGTTCSAYFNLNTTEVTLRAIPDPNGSSFSVWSGDCRSTSIPAECRVDLRVAPSVVAVFANGLPPVVAFSAPVYNVREDAGTAVAIVTRSGNLTGTSTVTVATGNTGTSRAGEHYVATRRTVTFGPGETTAAVAVGILADARVNGTHYVDLTLSVVKGAMLGAQSFSAIEISDDDEGGTIQLDAGGVFTVAEGARTALVTVTRTGTNLAGGVTVRYSAVGETATGSDFTPVAGTLSFGPRVTSRSFPVPIRDNTVVNGLRTIRLTLSAPGGGAVLGTPSTGQLTIVEDDSGGTFRLGAAAYPVNENAGAVTIVVTRTGTRLAGGVTVRFQTVANSAQPGQDYTEVTRTLTFTPNQVRQTVSVPIRNNQLADGGRTLTVMLLDPGAGAVLGEPATAEVRIVDDDQPVVRFATPSATVAEGGTVTLTLLRARGLGSPVTVGLALTGTADVSLEATSVTFGVGQTSRTVKLSAAADTRVSGPRTAQLTVGDPSAGTIGVPGTTTVTIREDDQGGAIQFSPVALAAVEGTTAMLTVTRTGANLASEVTVDFAVTGGTAVPGVDFVLEAGQLAFAAGQRSLTIAVPTLPHPGAPAGRTAKVTLSNPTGGAVLNANATLRTATLTIRAAPAP